VGGMFLVVKAQKNIISARKSTKNEERQYKEFLS